MSVSTTAGHPFGGMAFLRRFTVPEYHKLVEQGFFAEDEAFELLDGYLVRKMSRNPPHDDTLDRLEELLAALVPTGWFIRSQRAVTLPTSEPEPDFAVARGPRGRYRIAHPSPADVGLLIEVADTSWDRDRIDKARIYAEAGISIYWVVNVPDRLVVVLEQPGRLTGPAAYAKATEYHIGEQVPLILDGQTIGTLAVSDILP